MALKLTFLNDEVYAIQGNGSKQTTMEILPQEAGKYHISGVLKDKAGTEVQMKNLFSSLKTRWQSTAHEDIGPAEHVGETVSFDVEADMQADVAEVFSLEYGIDASALPGDYTIALSIKKVVAEGEEASEEQSHDIALHVVTVETALEKYEDKLIALSQEEVAEIEKQYADLDAMRQAVKTAILGLQEKDQPELMKRYYAAAENQYAAFKLIKQSQAAGNYLELEKVTNVGGNLPFQILFRDTIKLGGATEAYMFYPAGYKAAQLKIEGYPDSEPEDIVSKLVPEQTTLLVSNANPAGGEFLAVFKIGDKWHKTTYVVSADGTNLEKVNGISVNTPNEGDEAIIKKHTDKAALEKAIKDADDLLAATTPGKKIGQAPQKAINAFKEARDKAQNVKETTADYADYTDKDAFAALQKTLDDALAELTAATDTFKDAIISDADYAEEKVAEYETAAKNFFDGIRKKIRI